MKRFYVLAFVFISSFQLNAQQLVSSEFGNTLEAFLLNFTVPGLNATFSVDSYSIQYITTDTEGVEHVATGLISIPQTSEQMVFPLACFQHGTVAGREDVPSNLMGGYELGAAFASNGYVVVSPDYVGLGESPGVHPYVHAETEASAAVDLLLAAREFIDGFDNLTLSDQLFISGYSQGGHAAMALQQEIETNQSDLFTVTASAPMSGPYSISDRMIDFTLGDTEYFTVGYIAWLTIGYNRAYPVDLAEFTVERVFRPEFVADVNEFKDETIDLWELNSRMINTLIVNDGVVLPRNTLQADILDGLLNDPTHPFSVAAQLNDTHNFITDTPTNLYYCMGDDQVTFENAILAEEVMTANGSSNVQAIRMDTDAALLDHGGCIIPASLATLGFFNDLVENPSTSTFDPEYSDFVSVQYYDNNITVDMNEPGLNSAQLDIFHVSGQRIHTQQVSSGQTQLNLPADQPGQYFVTIRSNKGLLNVTPVINP